MQVYLENQALMYGLFSLFVLGMLVLDLGVFHRRHHVVSVKESLVWTTVWIVLALVFGVAVYFRYELLDPGRGMDAALQFATGYLIEKSLSIDNIFVFLLLFSYFKVPAQYQHRVLFWGIIGALVFRAAFIALGAVLIVKFQWILYIFGVFLVATGVKMAVNKDVEIHPEKNPVLRLFRKMMPVSADFSGGRFFVRENARRAMTPLMVVLVLIETTDIIFAVDSIPAIFAVTKDPFIVYTANVFAILGLRSLYFALAGVMRLFHHLHYGLSAILIFVGAKMLVAEAFHFKVPAGYSLGFVALCIIASIIASLIWPQKKAAGLPPESSQTSSATPSQSI